jgi:atypical dual specificity phosphatase
MNFLALVLWTACVYTFCVMYHSEITVLPLVKQLKYDVSLMHIKAVNLWFMDERWWDRIAPTRHFLGAQPQANWDHVSQISQLGVGAVLMLVEEFEERGGLLHSPVQARDWAAPLVGMAVYTVRARDFAPLRFVELDAALQWMREQEEHGRSVYVHCKAGRGRSASVLWAYLILAHRMEPDAALALLLRQRPSVNLGAAQRQLVMDYVRYVQCRVDSHCVAVHDEKFLIEVSQ